MTNVVPIKKGITISADGHVDGLLTSASMRDDGPPARRFTQKTSYGPGISSQVHRRYYGKVLVIVEAGFPHGFVFEPGEVNLDYVAADGSHPRDPREMVMHITGTGRMAAVHELPGGVQDRHGNEQDNLQDQGSRKALEP